MAKHNFPFRLGCTSYVVPADILPNVERTAPVFDDIEIVLFESLDASNMPGADILKGLADLSREHGNTYTIHFPIDKKAGSADPFEQTAFRKQMRDIVTRFEPLHPFAYLLHLEGIHDKALEPEKALWYSAARETCRFAASMRDVEPSRFCVENLGFPYEWQMPLVHESGLSTCLDIGHAWRYGIDWEKAVQEMLPLTRVIHLHGWNGTKDHVSLKLSDPVVLNRFLKLLKTYGQVVTLELFSESETFESVELLEELWRN